MNALAVTVAVGLGLLLVQGCATPLELGERRYREGDRLGALEVWRSADPSDPRHAAVQSRIEEVETEFAQLVVRYKKQARYFEDRDRLAESILNYRLALKLQPDDRATLDHVQDLVRQLDARKREAEAGFQQAFAEGRLAEASRELAARSALDPFDPQLQADDRRLDDALHGEVESLLARGRRGFSSGSHRSAARAFRKVLELDPENGAARGYLAYIATIRADERVGGGARSGDEPLGVNASENEIRAEGFYRNALEAERSGRPYAAIRHDLRALRIYSEHKAARRHLVALRRRLSSEVDPLIESGRQHYQQEELQNALDEWRRALLIQPENLRAREYVARAERLLANLEQLRAEPEARVGAR